MTEPVQSRIDGIIKSDDVVLFMKGNRNFPQCGFSATVVQILNGLIKDYKTINVLTDPDIRSGIKEYSNWPTIPQLYVRGEFIGGCDIIREMHQAGELHTTLGVTVTPPAPPTITVTDAARAALRDAIGESAGDVIHLSISDNFQHNLELGPTNATSVAVDLEGLTFSFDTVSAERAEGMSIDYVEGPEGAGFKIDNPNAPAKVTPISAQELKDKLASGQCAELFDVRTPAERDIATIADARLLDDEAMAYIDGLDKQTPLAFYCHHGMRSRSAAEHFVSKGFREVYNLTGGIDAWAQTVDPSLKRY